MQRFLATGTVEIFYKNVGEVVNTEATYFSRVGEDLQQMVERVCNTLGDGKDGITVAFIVKYVYGWEDGKGVVSIEEF